MKRLLISCLLLCNFVFADSMFMLTKIPKAYLIVENYSKKVNSEIKSELLEELKIVTDELGIDTTGYSHRTLGLLIYETYIDDLTVLNIDLVIGEQISRIDDKEEVYALTYEKKKQFFIDKLDEEEIHEKTADSVYLLLSGFSNQYKEDNI